MYNTVSDYSSLSYSYLAVCVLWRHTSYTGTCDVISDMWWTMCQLMWSKCTDIWNVCVPRQRICKAKSHNTALLSHTLTNEISTTHKERDSHTRSKHSYMNTRKWIPCKVDYITLHNIVHSVWCTRKSC